MVQMQKTKTTRLKGQTVNTYIGIVVALLIMGIITSVSTLANNSVTDTFTAGTQEESVGNNVSEMFLNFGTQLPTTGTLLGVGLLLLVLFVGIGSVVARRIGG